MKLQLNYGNRVLVLPAGVTEAAGATAVDWRVLCAFAADGTLCADMSRGVPQVAEQLLLSREAVTASVSFWRGMGVFSAATGDAAPTAKTPPRAAGSKKGMPDRGLPTYGAAELADIAESRADFTALVGACQQTFGKIFNAAEVGIIAGMTDYLGLEGDYILLLLSHCVRMEKKSLRYAEKTALSLYDDGVTDAVALEERLQRIETMATDTGQIRAMFGMASRAFTTKEKAMVENWVCVMKYTMDVIKLAYESTVDAIGKPSISYANTILERWHAEGYRDAQDVTRAMEEYRRRKQGGSSFDADDFFHAALKNTYGEV
ncbi:MAG: DnaD domain protein [Clostridia bacterium]|nr:DnaD domain protein [Clostridia bacterium]